MFNRTLYWHAIDVIESLPPGEPKTGTELFDSVIFPFGVREDIDVQLHRPGTKAAFLNTLHSIEETASRRGPIIHIEAHGLIDNSGISLANGETVNWVELKGLFTKINEASRLNLLVIMATCGGGHLLQILTPLDPAPVWGIIGPTNDIKTGDILEGFKAFYETFLRGGDGIEATRALNGVPTMRDWNWRFYSAELIFREVFRLHRAQAWDPVNRKERVDKIVANIRRSRPFGPVEESKLRRVFQQQLSEPRLAFEERKRVFFMLDKFPNNASRFPITYEDCAPRYGLD